MPGVNETKALVGALLRSRAAVAESATSPEQQRLIGPILSEIDRGIAALEPLHTAAAQLTPLDATTAPLVEKDVEALRREVERLRALAHADRGLLEAVLGHIPHGILVSDPHGKITLQNRASERIWAGSATADTVRGWGQYRAFHPDGSPYDAGDWSMARSLSTGEIIDAEEVHFQRFDGTHGVLLGSAAPIFGPDGAITGAISTFADITRFKQLERDLRVREAWLSTTLRSIADGVVATDDRGRIEFMNAVAERATGWTIDEAKGLLATEVVHVVDEKTGAPLEDLVARVLRTGVPVEVPHAKLVRRASFPMGETPKPPPQAVASPPAHPTPKAPAQPGTECQRSAGRLGEAEPICVDQCGAPIRNEAGEPLGVVLVFRDVTEKRRAEERRFFLAEASRRLASLTLDYEGTLDSVAKLALPDHADWCFVDLAEPDGSLTRAAVAHVDRDRAPLAALLSQRPSSGSNGGGAGAPRPPGDVVRQMIAAGEDAAYTERLARLTPEAAITVPLRARDRTIGVMTFVWVREGRTFGPDDAALVRQLGNTAALALDNARLYREAQRVNRVKDEFLATLSHELRTPLNAVLGWARLLRLGKLDEAAKARALETIERNAAAQAQLIEDLLDVSRIISGKFQVEVRVVDLGAVTEAALDAVRLAAEAKSIKLAARIEPLPQLAGDPTRLQQVVWNLLSNAIKFTPKGGRVDVRVLAVESHVEIQVADDGEGIRKDFLPYVFDRFRQADGTTTRAHSGLGLGLAIVRHLVELHGGSVRAESEGEGRGALFSVRLPVAAVRPRQPGDAAAEAPRPGGEGDVGLPLAGLRVVVVDDENDARELVTAVLSESGARVVAVASVAEAILAVVQHRPDVLVSDIGMPCEDGYSLMRRLRAMEDTVGRIPAAALTAYATVQDRTRALLEGYSSHLPKPIEPAELTAVVANLAGRPARG